MVGVVSVGLGVLLYFCSSRWSVVIFASSHSLSMRFRSSALLSSGWLIFLNSVCSGSVVGHGLGLYSPTLGGGVSACVCIVFVRAGFSGAVVLVRFAGVASAVCCQSRGLFFILFCSRSSKLEGFSAIVVSSGSPCAVFSLAWRLPCLSVGRLVMGFS